MISPRVIHLIQFDAFGNTYVMNIVMIKETP